jgi:hypothetical protein
MTLRQLFILFSSATATSLIVLLLFFGLFFESFDITFDTKLPDAAPDFQQWSLPSGRPSVTDALGRAVLNVPVESVPKPRPVPNNGKVSPLFPNQNLQDPPAMEDIPTEAGVGIYPTEGIEPPTPQTMVPETSNGLPGNNSFPTAAVSPAPPPPKHLARPKKSQPILSQDSAVVPPSPEAPVPDSH